MHFGSVIVASRLILKMQICQWSPLWSFDNVQTTAKWTSARFSLKATGLHYSGHSRCAQTSHNVQTCHRVHFCGLFLLQFNKSLSSSTQWPHQLCALLGHHQYTAPPTLPTLDQHIETKASNEGSGGLEWAKYSRRAGVGRSQRGQRDIGWNKIQEGWKEKTSFTSFVWLESLLSRLVN